MRFEVSHFTVAQAESPGRENEDTLFFAEDHHILSATVLDGASALSSVTGVGRLKEQTGLFAAETGCESLKSHCLTGDSATTLIAAANQYLGVKLLGQRINPNDYDDTELSNAQIVVANIYKARKILNIALLGDAACLIRRTDGTTELPVKPDFTKEDREALQLALDTSKQTNLCFRDALKTEPYSKIIDDILLRGRMQGNKPDGSGVGVLDGRNSAIQYIRAIDISLEDITDVALLTDGLFLPQQDIYAEPDWQGMMDILAKKGLEGLYDEVTRLKNSDPDFNKLPRLKKHDDATGILIKISP